MANYICIDSGTTNTRIALVCDNMVCDLIKYHIGAKNLNAGNAELKHILKTGILEILKNNGLNECDISAVLACGMITSSFGLLGIPHICVPVGIETLKNAIRTTVIKEVSDLPINFIPGVKTTDNKRYETDMMRGEETELMGLLCGEGVYVLPGSHNKIIKVDEGERIVSFTTLLTGEMIAAVAENTILSSVIDLQNAQFDTQQLIDGYTFAKEHGLNKALFQVRVLKEMFNFGMDETYSFFIGAMLLNDISEIIKMQPTKVFIGGNKLKNAIFIILKTLTNIDTIQFSEKECENATSVGMVKVFEYK